MAPPKPRLDPEIQALIPPLTKDELARLEASLRQNGCLDPLTIWEQTGVLLDGHHRLELCSRHGIQFQTRRIPFASKEEALLWTLEYQLARRNLTPFQRCELVLKEKPYLAARAKERMREGGHIGGLAAKGDSDSNHPIGEKRTHKLLSERAGVSDYTLHQVGKVLETGTPSLLEAARSGAVAIDPAAAVASLPPERQDQVVAKGSEAFRAAAKAINRQRKLERRQQRIEAFRVRDWPDGKFRVLYADPPWQYDNAGNDQAYGHAERHYPTLPLEEICALPVQELALDDAVLFLWVTEPLLMSHAPAVIKAWGFTHKAGFIWDKEDHNFGSYNSVQHEHLLICTRGSCVPDIDKKLRSIVSAKKSRKHSEKPEVFREIIDQLYPHGPRVELFARGQEPPGWVFWGNEVEEVSE